MKYVDSSAFVKFYLDESREKGADKVKTIIDRAKNGKETLISSILLIGEVTSALDKWVRLRILEREQFVESLRDFINDIKELTDRNAIVLEDISAITMTVAVDYIVKYHLTVNDAVHLYTALIKIDEIEEFVSSDRNLNAAAKKEGLRILNPEE